MPSTWEGDRWIAENGLRVFIFDQSRCERGICEFRGLFSASKLMDKLPMQRQTTQNCDVPDLVWSNNPLHERRAVKHQYDRPHCIGQSRQDSGLDKRPAVSSP